jgi:hypothetical protein
MQSQKIISERQRKLQPIPFAPSTVISRDLPRDTVLKYLELTLSGSVITTYGSGTPVADAQSTMDNLVSNIDIVVNGSRTIKNCRPHLLAMSQLLATTKQNVRRASAGAAAVANPVTEGGFVYGTTTQVTSVRESILIPFENYLAPVGKEATWLNLKGVSSATINLNTRGFSSLLGYGNTAPVVYSGSTFQFEIKTIEAQDVPAEKYFSDYKQTTKSEAFTAQTNNRMVELNRGNFLQGVMLFAQDGAAGSATTATGKLASDLLLTDLNIKINGQQDIKSNDFLGYQTENINRFGANAPYSGGVSRYQGVCYIDMLRDGDITTALDTRPPMVDQIFLDMSTRAGVTYTDTANVTIMTSEIVNPIGS